MSELKKAGYENYKETRYLEKYYDYCGWCAVLENGLNEKYEDDYGYYGDKLFKAIDEMYNFGLVDKNTFDKEFYTEW